jgi:catechol 2,3-dioxygenase-like lactoylglutathione lyase family enzyme
MKCAIASICLLVALACAPTRAIPADTVQIPSTPEQRQMEPRINVITLGVDNLERALAFYRNGLGLPTKGIIGTQYEDGAVVFFEMNHMTLALYPRKSLAKDANLPLSAPSPTELSIGYMVRSDSEVDALIAQAKAAGATITETPRRRFWGGYSGYFQDPDGHLWEIAWNPEWEGKD